MTSNENTERQPSREELEVNGVTELVIDGNRYDICADNADEMLDFIKRSLQPGTPVIQEVLNCGHKTFSRPFLVANFFFSDGTMDDSRRFGIKNGKDGATYAKLYGNGEYRLTKGGFGRKVDEPLSLPSVGYSDSWNEGTFSMSGGWSQTTKHASGTQRLVIGEHASLVGREVIGGIEFVQDALRIAAPHFYSAETSAITTPDNLRNTISQNDEIFAASRKKDMISFALKMLSCAGRELDSKFLAKASPEQRLNRQFFDDHCSARQVSTFTDGANGIEIDGYLIAPDDFIIAESSSHRRHLGYLKTSDTMRGEGYFLPAQGMKTLANLAFSEKHIKQYYPKS